MSGVKEIGKPTYEVVVTQEIAIAKTIESLLSDKKIMVMLLSQVDKQEIPRYSLMLSIASDFKLEWLEEYVINELALTSAIKGKRSEQIVTITKAPTITSENLPFMDRAKRRLGLT